MRDAGISSVAGEETANNGGAKTLKLKGQQEYMLLDIDPSGLKGKIVSAALLHTRSASPDKAPLARVGVSTVASPWTEGTKHYAPQTGSACYLQAEYERRDWAYAGSTLADVVFGRGHTLWKFADSAPPDRADWQTLAVDARVVAARVAGLSHGFCLWDEVGSEWSCKEGKFKFIYFPNRLCHTREKSRSAAPWMEVWISGEDRLPPEPITSLKADTKALPAGQALLSWRTPQDQGLAKTLGFHVSYGSQKGEEKPFPRYLIPMAGEPGEEVRMHIQDMDFASGETIWVSVEPVDNAGNIGKAFSEEIRLSAGIHMPAVPEVDIEPFPSDTNLPRVGDVRIAVVDLLDKADAENGKMIPRRKKGYRGGNHIFSAKERRIRLQAARNEFVAFQVNVLANPESQIPNPKDFSLEYEFAHHPKLRPRMYQFGYVDVTDKNGKKIARLPDPIASRQSPVASDQRPAARNQQPETSSQKPAARNQQPETSISLLCELYVPHEETPGKKLGKVVVSAGGERLELDVDLTVWNFTLPNKLSFVPEMNAYGTVSPYEGYEYYRVAHEHRVCVNRLPYGWDGRPAFAPKWDGKGFGWQEWDEKVGPLLDGSAFEDMPRKDEPLDVFYLPFSENWPVSLFGHYEPSYWADEAFDETYEKELRQAFAAFAKHCEEKKWHDTVFQFYLNNKVIHRQGFDGSSAPWFFDEPANTQDFWALRWYGLLWRAAVDPVAGDARMCYRGDISYSQFGRNMLWGLMDMEYLGKNDSQKTRMKRDEQTLFGKSHFAEYGTVNKIGESNLQPVKWCLSAWAKGAAGVLPWQTMGTAKSWKVADQTALFYPHPQGPKPSLRLKAFTRGQQDVEYLALFCDAFDVPRFEMAAWLERSLGPKSDVDDLWRLRYRIGNMLSRKAPPYKRAIADQDMPRGNIRNLPDIGHAEPAPKIETHGPDCDGFM